MNTRYLSTEDLLETIHRTHTHILICDALDQNHTSAERTLEILTKDFLQRVQDAEGVREEDLSTCDLLDEIADIRNRMKAGDDL